MLGERVTVGEVVSVGITDVEGDDEAITDGIDEGEGLDATEGSAKVLVLEPLMESPQLSLALICPCRYEHNTNILP